MSCRADGSSSAASTCTTLTWLASTLAILTVCCARFLTVAYADLWQLPHSMPKLPHAGQYRNREAMSLLKGQPPLNRPLRAWHRVVAALRDKRAEEALRLSEDRYARAMLSANAGFWDWDVEKDEYYTSPRFIEMVGFPPGTAFAGREDFHYRSNYFPEDREKWREGVRELFAGSGSRLAMEVRLTVAGETRWHAMYGMCFRENGKVVRWTGSATDVTERKQAEEALRLSEERYARAIEGADVGHWDCNLVTQEMFVSARMKVMLGFAPDTAFANRAEFVDKQNFLPGERQRLEEALRGSFADPEGRYEIDYLIRLPSGESRWMRSQGKLFRDDDGKPVRMAGSMTDVTERKRIEQESRGRQEMLEVAQKAARAVQWEWRNAADPWSQGWSPELEAMFGLLPGAYDGTFATWRKMVHPGDWADVKSAIAHALATGEIDVEYRVVHPDSKVRWLNQKGRTFLGHDGKPVRSIGFMFDVTERRQAEGELRKLEQKLRRAQRLEAMGTLAGGIAHDFNNILHAILGYGEIAVGMAKKGTRLRHAVDSIVAAGERGRRLVDRILAFSRSGVAERVAVHVEEAVR